MSPQYDVEILSPNGRSGDTVRVEAADEAAAKVAALATAPEGWTVVGGPWNAEGHGEAWGVDTTAPDYDGQPVVGTEPED